jgi:hypothetical protein
MLCWRPNLASPIILPPAELLSGMRQHRAAKWRPSFRIGSSRSRPLLLFRFQPLLRIAVGNRRKLVKRERPPTIETNASVCSNHFQGAVHAVNFPLVTLILLAPKRERASASISGSAYWRLFLLFI